MNPRTDLPATGIIMLSAGSSSRMGQPKQMLPIANQSLIQLMAEEACQSMANPVVVVTGMYHTEITVELDTYPVVVVQNKNWQKGMGSSIRVGIHKILETFPALDAVILMVSDQPYLRAQHLDNLLLTHYESNKSIIASYYKEQMGTPVLFAKDLFPDLMQLNEGSGAQPLLKLRADRATSIPFPLGNIDLDSWEDYLAFIEGRSLT
ncbi:nucleotidyltransferase family protein [Dyadobacter tibetensis]|uniref:nucleotidyltransferase family protein n=1 Tax=Dyadobacter tibetensis TaxID=1211851 RepID=UPI000471D929|nr:nucleotidyltransferase family protein [Dyadobacter tibetensis]